MIVWSTVPGKNNKWSLGNVLTAPKSSKRLSAIIASLQCFEIGLNTVMLGVSVEFHQGELASGGESNFINIEMKKLLQAFKRVIVVPEKCEGRLLVNLAGQK